MIRAVFDPGVLILAAISPAGSPAVLLRAWAEGRFDLVVSPTLLEELGRVLRRPKFRRWVPEEDIAEMLDVLASQAVLEADPEEVPSVTPDPGDDYLVALAIAAGAHILVSGDAHLLGLRDLRPPVRTPREFLDALG